jgi:hypothetical protein
MFRLLAVSNFNESISKNQREESLLQIVKDRARVSIAHDTGGGTGSCWSQLFPSVDAVVHRTVELRRSTTTISKGWVTFLGNVHSSAGPAGATFSWPSLARPTAPPPHASLTTGAWVCLHPARPMGLCQMTSAANGLFPRRLARNSGPSRWRHGCLSTRLATTKPRSSRTTYDLSQQASFAPPPRASVCAGLISAAPAIFAARRS